MNIFPKTSLLGVVISCFLIPLHARDLKDLYLRELKTADRWPESFLD